MSEKNLEEIVRAAVAQALERQLPNLRENIVQDVLLQVDGKPTGGRSRQGSTAESLQKAIAAIHAGATQKEILRALLENCALYSGRTALFVIKAGAASGWQGVGFSSDESVKDFPLNIASGLAAAAMQSRLAESGDITEVDPKFVSKFDAPAQERVVVLPLLLKDKVSALVYADSGDSGTLDNAALDILVRATSAWLEVISQRKQAQKEGVTEVTEATHSAPPVNDPFAAHAPLHSGRIQNEPEPAPAAAMSAAASSGGATAVSATPASSGEDTEIHRKAQRFARLLMDEIKLYNQAKVAEGRKHKDLYDRLKEDIEKSRATYQKRYGNTAAASADYFNLELIRSLAEDDVSLLGSNFRR